MPEGGTGGTASRKRGGRLGYWIFKTSASWFGLSGAYGLLYFVSLYYLIFDPAAVSPCMAYLRRRFKGRGGLRRALGVYRIFINQGKAIIDRYYVASGLGRFDMEIYGYDKISGLLKDSGKGFLLLTAHVGNWQVTMTALERFGKTVHLLMRPEEDAAAREALNIGRESARIRVISPEGFLGGVVESVKAVSSGEIVSIMGDRSYEADSVEVDFLGGRARFPYFAFRVAASVGCPVVVLLSAKTSTDSYIVDVSNVIRPAYSSKGERREDIRGWVREFAVILEGYVQKYPYQWFVFNDVWV
jgi:predicted LPLAT superfamily acyltransferase